MSCMPDTVSLIVIGILIIVFWLPLWWGLKDFVLSSEERRKQREAHEEFTAKLPRRVEQLEVNANYNSNNIFDRLAKAEDKIRRLEQMYCEKPLVKKK